ncbi:MAG TPA: serine hydrolase domain-containing protein [Terriglobia bacterium]|nr:serine hydrolase domain-containing protein [Terriglobia bacterium]
MMRHSVRHKSLILILLLISMAASAQVSTSQIDALFSKFSNPKEPGCAVLVIKDGKPLFRKGYGVADLRSMHAIGPEINFRLASLTKQFTATAVMLLVRDGKLKYEDRLTDVLPDFPSYGKAITIRHLLNHTSGLMDYENIMDKKYAGIPDEKIPQIKDAAVLELLKQQTGAKFPSGTRWDYSNSGYVVLAMIVERKSGMSFGDFLRERIFRPLEMDQTIAYERGKNEVTNRAYGHTLTSGKWRETDQSSTSATLGDGGVYTSLDDLEKWDRALTRHVLLTEQEMAPALAPPVARSAAPLQNPDGTLAPDYGFGWFLDTHRGHRRYAHYGETVGFRTAIQRFPDDRLTVIVLANRAELDAPALAESVADLYLGKP